MSETPENIPEQDQSVQAERNSNAETSAAAPAETAAATAVENQPDAAPADPMKNLEQILKLKIPVIVKVAEKNMKLSAVLKLTMGSIIQFEKDAYQHVDLMVNNSTIGLGQPVKIGENFGLRITQIGDLADTIRSLGAEEQK